MKALAIIVIALLFVGCESRYRYECQNPDNWEKAQCQRPACEANGLCPDMLLGKPQETQQSEIVTDCNCENTGE